MLIRVFKYLVSLVILLHCIGATQLASACAKDKSAFISMLNMTEEETKKEKEAKEDADDHKDLRCKPVSIAAQSFQLNKYIDYSDSKNRIKHQFHSECTTPPPDLSV